MRKLLAQLTPLAISLLGAFIPFALVFFGFGQTGISLIVGAVTAIVIFIVLRMRQQKLARIALAEAQEKERAEAEAQRQAEEYALWRAKCERDNAVRDKEWRAYLRTPKGMAWLVQDKIERSREAKAETLRLNKIRTEKPKKSQRKLTVKTDDMSQQTQRPVYASPDNLIVSALIATTILSASD